jgi:glyoxylase-like metal-dependent hydrolase (beta-lactamase superfamily II)
MVLFVASACMGIVELRPHLYRLNLGRYQAYLWRDDDSITLIDTGEVGSAPAIAEALRQVGLAPGDLDRLVLTHFHDDHVGSAAEVSSWGAVQVVAHAMDAPAIRGAMSGPAPKFTEFERELHARVAAGLQSAPPVRIDLEVHDGDVLDFGGGAQVVSTPGHTDGSIALHLPRHGVVVTGDIAAEYEGEVILGVFNLDRAQAAASFRRIADLEADVACFGHGEPVVGGAGARLQQAAAALSAG